MSCTYRKCFFYAAYLLISITVVYLIYVKLNKLTEVQETSFNQEIQDLNQSQVIQNLALQTLYYDEVLTQSVRNYAFTGDIDWKTRYRTNEELLSMTIAIALQNKDTLVANNFLELSHANDSLVFLELRAIRLVEQNKLKEAQKILDSNYYWELKDAYLYPIKDYMQEQEEQFTSIYDQIEARINDEHKNEEGETAELRFVILLIIIVLLGSFALGMYLMVNFVKSRLATLTKKVKILQDNSTDKRINYVVKDGFGKLADQLNDLLDNIEKNNDKQTQNIINESQKSQLERFGRELHDSLGIIFSSMKLLLEKVKFSLKATNKNEYVQFKNLINEGYAQVRELSNVPVPEAVIFKGLKNALKKLFVRTEMIFPVNIDLITNVEENQLNDQEQVHIYLIIRELLNNAVKHAQCEHLIIQIIEHDDSLMITFEDDGIGLSEDNFKNRTTGGIANIKQRILSQNGTMNIEFKQGSGTIFIIEFPNAMSTLETALIN